MFSLRKLSINCFKSPTFQTVFRGTKYSTAKQTVVFQNNTESNHEAPKENVKTSISRNITKVREVRNTGMVAAAFASLQSDEAAVNLISNNVSYNDKNINSAKNVKELLTVAEDSSLTRGHALKIVSVLAQWSTTGKIKLADFETDPRFVKVCRILSRSSKSRPNTRVNRGDDLSMVMGVTGDDEAAKLVASITLSQMVKVMSTLSFKKRRSTPLLRSLAYNISRSTEKLDLKQCADLLYSMTVLNFPEPLLFQRISNDVLELLHTNKDKSAVVGSILTSIGLMKYKDIRFLNALSDWILKHHDVCRPQDIQALFLTLAIVNHQPDNAENLYKVLVPQLNMSDTQKPSTWLDVVWSLVILNQVTEKHLLSVFDPEFIEKLHGTSGLSIASKVKLLNINAAAKLLLPSYKGPVLPEICQENSIMLSRTKEKQAMVSAVLDSLGSLLPSQTYFKTSINTQMGFYIDGVCTIDKKCNPLPIEAKESSPNQIKVAIMVYDYHDMCRGITVPHGGNVLIERLLKVSGYTVMPIPYTEFNTRDKLVHRVQVIEKQLKNIASSA